MARDPATQLTMLAALRRFPSKKDAIESLGLVTLFGLIALAWGRHLVDLSQMLTAAELLKVAIVSFWIPVLAEEMVFRGAMIRRCTWKDAVISNLLYVFWHPIEALTFFPGARSVFFDPIFLLLVALLGTCCTIAYVRSKSIWPGVVIHWLVVMGWKGLGGARFG